jgi:hypothetical protein
VGDAYCAEDDTCHRCAVDVGGAVGVDGLDGCIGEHGLHGDRHGGTAFGAALVEPPRVW